ncbi:MAG TPA: hypothetical protein PLQ41_06795 [bacterium]|nr:hypothetical protein [bacterium]HPP29921.1 hypothetical protein [bacterium]
MIRIDATGLHYKVLNDKIKELVNTGCDELFIKNVCGHRYIGSGLQGKNVKIMLEGIPGNDLGIFIDGPEIVIKNNVQDGTGNTMNSGRIIVYGNAGDITGHSMRGGEIFIRGDAGYRTGIHMKEYKDMHPVIVIGGSAGDFLGEYMAGGIIILLGMTDKQRIGDYIGTGMHGGVIYVGENLLTDRFISGKEVKIFDLDNHDMEKINPYLKRFMLYYSISENEIPKRFYKIVPVTKRPYGKIYAY